MRKAQYNSTAYSDMRRALLLPLIPMLASLAGGLRQHKLQTWLCSLAWQ